MVNDVMTGDEMATVVRRSAARALNQIADKVAADSLPEVPLENGELRASAVYPGNDPDGPSSATDEKLEATVSYNTVYAAAQHEGWAEQNRMHPAVYIKDVGWRTLTDKLKPHTLVWVVKHHTEPGTKSHFLSDPFKSMIPRMEPFVAASIAKGLDEANRP
jgi:Minor capsid protein